jgi:hypothetical protein
MRSKRFTAAQGRIWLLMLFVAGLMTFFIVGNTVVVDPIRDAVPAAAAPAPSTTPAKREPCLSNSRPFYFANLPATVKEGKRSFGPPMAVQKPLITKSGTATYTNPFKPTKLTRDDVSREIVARLCGRAGWNGQRYGNIHGGDQAFYLAFTTAYDHKDPNRQLTHKEWEDGVQYLIETGIQFSDIKVERRVAEPTGYTTYMEPNQDRTKAPRIGATKFGHWVSWVVTIPVKLGNKIVSKRFRGDCGLQLLANSLGELPTTLRGQVA